MVFKFQFLNSCIIACSKHGFIFRTQVTGDSNCFFMENVGGQNDQFNSS